MIRKGERKMWAGVREVAGYLLGWIERDKDVVQV